MPAERRTWGVALVLLAVCVNPLTVGWVLTSDGDIGQVDVFACVLFVSALCLLGGLQLLLAWADPLSWVKPVSTLRAVSFVVLVSAAIALTYWGVTTFNNAHHHAEVVGDPKLKPTPAQEAWAKDFYRRSLAAALKHHWFDFDEAMKQGFQPDRINRTHFPNLDNMFDDVILDPERPEWLVYDDTPEGKVLMALMFFTRNLTEVGPTPGGPLAQWHYHPYRVVRCAVKGLWTVGNTDNQGHCQEGEPVTRTPEMLHVWFLDHPLGRFTEMKLVAEYWQEDAFDWRLVHPVVVHFTIALFVIAVLLDWVAVVTGRREFHRTAWINLALSAVATVLTVAAGMTAETLLIPTAEAHATLDIHRWLGCAGLVAVLALTTWRYALRGEFPRKGAALYLVLATTAMGIIAGAGYFGGEMVYRHGAAVRASDDFLRARYWQYVRDHYLEPSQSLIEELGDR